MKTAPSRRNAKRKRSVALGKYRGVLNVYMEEPPLVSDWRKLTKTRNVVVVPFFISDGLHSYEDIPRCSGSRMEDRQILRTRRAARFSDAIPIGSRVARYSTRHPSAPIPVSQISSSNKRKIPVRQRTVEKLLDRASDQFNASTSSSQSNVRW